MPVYLFENAGDEESPAKVAQEDAEALAPAERVKLVREEHAEDGVLVLGPLAKIAPSLEGQFVFRERFEREPWARQNADRVESLSNMVVLERMGWACVDGQPGSSIG